MSWMTTIGRRSLRLVLGAWPHWKRSAGSRTRDLESHPFWRLRKHLWKLGKSSLKDLPHPLQHLVNRPLGTALMQRAVFRGLGAGDEIFDAYIFRRTIIRCDTAARGIDRYTHELR